MASRTTRESFPTRPIFQDRVHAGRVLALRLGTYAGCRDVIVLALPRGGVPVGYEVAFKLAAPLDVFIVRKLGVPGRGELAMGAIASGGVRVLNEGVVGALGISEETIARVAGREAAELERREQTYRGHCPAPELQGRTVVLVDDGLATGATMRAASAAVRQRQATRIVVAVPVAAPDVCRGLELEADEVVCAVTPEPFHAVGSWYGDFTPTTDDEVRELLHRAAEWRSAAA
jgi:putative phosphoribosyl transferase